MHTLVATDGARQQSQFWDSVRNEACNFVSASDGKIRCLPVTAFGLASQTSGFVDAQCSIPAFVSGYCAQATYGMRASISCSYQYELHTIAPISTIYVLSGTACVQGQVPAGYAYFKSTGIINPTSFVAADYVIE